MLKTVNGIHAFLILTLLVLPIGCATEGRGSAASHAATVIAELVSRYPPTEASLDPQKLTTDAISALPAGVTHPEVYVVVHPGYAKFFRDPAKEPLSPAKAGLLELQFNNEIRSVRERVDAGSVVILVVPGRYLSDAVAPKSYIAYINDVTRGGKSVYFVLSETSSTGHLPADDMVNLYHFLETQHIRTVMIGGGYVGRCEREFYNQLTSYIDRKTVFLVPELSTVSPDDLTEDEAADMLGSITRRDYSLVKAMIDKKSGGNANILSLPASPTP